jgi:hypothetical protein
MIDADTIAEFAAAGFTGEQIALVAKVFQRLSADVTRMSAERRRKDAERKRKSREIQNGSPPSLSPIPPITTPPPSVDKALVKKGTRLPENWEPTEDSVQWARDECKLDNDQIKEITAEFRDYFCAAPGQRGVKLDWDRTWKNSVRRFLERNHKVIKLRSQANGLSGHKNTPQPSETREEYIRRLAAMSRA